MIILDKDSDVRFSEKDKWPLLFAIADIFKRYSSEENPLSVDKVSEILRKEYGIGKVDRHAVKDYRQRLEDYFNYQFIEVKKKGFYLNSVEYMINDDELMSIAIMIQCNKSFSQETKEILLESLVHYAGSDNAKALVEEVGRIRVVDENDDPREKVTVVIQRLLKVTKTKQKIVIRYHNPWATDLTSVSLYPQFVFVKDNEFYLLGMTYLKKQDFFISSAEVFKIKNIHSFKIESKSGKDPYQDDGEHLTIYPFKKDPYKIRIEDYISMLGTIKERSLSTRPIRNIVTGEVEIKAWNYDNLIFLLDSLQSKYGYGNCISIKNFIDETNQNTGRTDRKRAIVSISIPEDELMGLLFSYSRWMTLVGPNDLLRRYKTRLLKAGESITIGNRKP